MKYGMKIGIAILALLVGICFSANNSYAFCEKGTFGYTTVPPYQSVDRFCVICTEFGGSSWPECVTTYW